jgi:hypothetical protein
MLSLINFNQQKDGVFRPVHGEFSGISMNEKLIPTLLSIGFVVFVIFVVLTSPLRKLNALCWPVEGLGDVVVAGARMLQGESQAQAQRLKWEKNFNTCRVFFWNLFYEDAYRKELGQTKPTMNHPPLAPTAPAVPAPSDKK